MKKIKVRKSPKKLNLSADNAPESSNSKKIIFSLQYMSQNYCISRCEKSEKIAFVDQLKILGTITWQQATEAPKHGIGFEKISNIKEDIPTHLKGDKDVQFIAFRFDGKKPMVGYRKGEIFHIIWLDRAFTLYDHG